MRCLGVHHCNIRYTALTEIEEMAMLKIFKISQHKVVEFSAKHKCTETSYTLY